MMRICYALLGAIIFATAAPAMDGAGPVASPGVLDSASYGQKIAPGSMITVFGENFAQETVAADSIPLPRTMAGASLEIDDGMEVRQAPLFLVSPTQINAQMPFLPAGTSVAVRVRNDSGVADAGTVTLDETAPALFTGDGGSPLLFHADGSAVNADCPAVSGETISAFLTGLGAVDPPVEAGEAPSDAPDAAVSRVVAPVDVKIDGLSANISFAALAPGRVGIYRVDFTVPDELDTATYEVAVQAGAAVSQAGLVAAFKNSVEPRQFWVSPDASSTGDGSSDNPWDLQTALAPASAIRPGDTVWMRGGTYGDGSTIFKSRLAGTVRRPITLRQAPGERATINGGLAIYGPYTRYWGFEVTNTSTDRGPSRDVPQCIDTYQGSVGVKLINLVLHDCNQGVGFWMPAENAELYGSLIYYNGNQGTDRGHGHGIYTQNRDGTKTIADNIVFNQFGLGIQAFGSDAAWVQGYDVRGNILFNNGCISTGGANVDNILFAIGVPMERIRLEDNYTYHTPDINKGYSRVGWGLTKVPNRDVTVRGNYWIGGISAFELWAWEKSTFTGNVSYSKDALNGMLSLAPGQSTTPYSWDDNTYYGAGKFRFNGGQNQNWSGWKQLTGLDGKSKFASGRPSGLWAFVRPNKYEPGRANIVIYNWELDDTVRVDVSCALSPGAKYVVRDAQNFFGDPIARGTYDGSPIAIPMTGLQVAPPVGDVPTPPRHTAPQFGAFVLLPE